MKLKRTPFDAVLTDINGLRIEVDCRVSEPAAGGLSGEILIEIPLPNKDIEALENPCSLRGGHLGFEFEVKNFWYRSISSSLQHRKHARGLVNVTYAEQLWVKKAICTNEPGRLRFILSPIRFLKKHRKAEMVEYSSTPQMLVLLFTIQAVDIGEIRFVKFWSVHRVDANGVSAEVRANYAAEVRYDGKSEIEHLVKKIRELLTPLSILTRQAITLHGWHWEKPDGIQTMWFDLLEPNLAPYMAEEPELDLCFPAEFETHAQAIVSKFLQFPPNLQETINLLSIALSPHVKQSQAENFIALFGALEEVVALVRLSQEEKDKLRETDQFLMKALLEKSDQLKESDHPHASAIAGRLEGYAKAVGNSGPSFKVRFDKFMTAYPSLHCFLPDLWPLQGTEQKPGLKQIRDSLAHGLRRKYSPQAIAVAHWHFARLAERIAFILLGLDMPEGISPNSFLLSREPWYERTKWQSVQATAKSSS